MYLSGGSSISSVVVATAFASGYTFALRLIFSFVCVLAVSVVSTWLLFCGDCVCGDVMYSLNVS